MPWSVGLCQGQLYPSHREGGWIVIAVWLTLNSSADGMDFLERLGHRPVGTGSDYRPAGLLQHPDQHRPQHPVFLAVDQGAEKVTQGGKVSANERREPNLRIKERCRTPPPASPTLRGYPRVVSDRWSDRLHLPSS
jgi:hypothetical protein